MNADLQIDARWIIPVVPSGVVLDDHSLIVRGGRIVAVMPTSQANQTVDSTQRRSLPNHALVPGLVNAHCHAAMTLLRGIADDLPLMTWLNDHIWPVEGALVSAQMVHDGASLAAYEMLAGGITAVNDQYFFPESSAKAYRDAGMRASLGIPIVEFPTPYARDADDYLRRGLALADEVRGDPLLVASFAPHAPYTVSDESFKKIRTYSDQLNVRIQCHIHETAFEVEDARSKTGERPFARLKRLGLIGPDLTAVHMTQLTPAEIEDVARFGVVVAHCPESNLKLASGFCPVAALLKAGAKVAIGTDGAASNNDLDLLGETKTAALLAKAVAMDAAALSAAEALEAATLSGARSLGMDETIGSLEVGKWADVCAIDFSGLHLAPVFNPISHIVYAASRRDISDVWVAGRERVRAGVVLGADPERLRALANEWALKARAVRP